jgi:DNA primase
MAVVNEHPNAEIRKLYAGEVAAQLDMPVRDLVAAAQRGGRSPVVIRPPAARRSGETKEFMAIALLVQRWDEIAELLVEGLFDDDVHLRAFRALAAAGGDLDRALAVADPEARDVLERAAVVDVDDIDIAAEARLLLDAAVRRELARRTGVRDPEEIREDTEARRLTEELAQPNPSEAVCDWLLAWVDRRSVVEGPPQGTIG